MPLHYGMPATAMRTPKQITELQWAFHSRSMCKLRDNAGQRSLASMFGTPFG